MHKLFYIVRMNISQGPGNIVFMAVLFIIFAVSIYYLYKWLNGANNDMKDLAVYTTSTGLIAMSSTTTTVSDSMPQLYGGGEFSISTWIYITNWGINKGANKVFLTLSGGSGSFSTIVMYLGQNINKLGVRVSYDTSNAIGTANTLDTTQMGLIKNSVTPYTDVASDFKKCDIESVDLQRWVNVTAVLSGRTLDVYMDGKLSRSCVLDGIYKVDGDKTTLVLGGPNGFGGFIGQTRAANFAYSPDQVYRKYLNGPFDGSIWTWIKRYFNPSITVDVKLN